MLERHRWQHEEDVRRERDLRDNALQRRKHVLDLYAGIFREMEHVTDLGEKLMYFEWDWQGELNEEYQAPIQPLRDKLSEYEAQLRVDAPREVGQSLSDVRNQLSDLDRRVGVAFGAFRTDTPPTRRGKAADDVRTRGLATDEAGRSFRRARSR